MFLLLLEISTSADNIYLPVVAEVDGGDGGQEEEGHADQLHQVIVGQVNVLQPRVLKTTHV